MKRTIAIKLTVSAVQNEALCELQDMFTKGCNEVASVAAVAKERNRIRLHHLCYRALRQSLPQLGSQMCCNVIAKTAASLKALKHPKQVLFKHGCSVHFDKRTYSLKNGDLSLFTMRGRIQIPLEISTYHQGFLDIGIAREAELVHKGKRWFFHLVLDLPDVLPSIKLSPLGESCLRFKILGRL